MRTSFRFPSRRAVAVALATTLAAGAAHALPGQLDLGFGDNGVYTLGTGGTGERASALLAAPGSKTIVAGALYRQRVEGVVSAGNDMAILRLNADGSLDGTFGAGGIARVNGGQGDSQEGFDVVRQPDGKLLVAGQLEEESYTDSAVARLLPDGTLDPSYGQAAQGGGRKGFRMIDLGIDSSRHDDARGIVLQSTGKAVIAAQAKRNGGNFDYYRFTLARLDANGDIDTTFGNSGTGIVVSQPVTVQSDEFVTAVGRLADDTLPADDRILVVGYVANRGYALMRRYTANGLPDASFGTGGTVAIEDVASGGVRTGLGRIDDAVILPNGKILLVGRGGDRGFAFLRYNANGTPDTTFGTNGRTLVKISDGSQYDVPSALAVQRNGKIVASGYGTVVTEGSVRKDMMVVRLLPNGRRDAGFGDNGVFTYPMSDEGDDAFAVKVLANGRIVAAGEAYMGATPIGNDLAVLGVQGDPEIFSDGFESD